MKARWKPEDYLRRPKDFDPLAADRMIERIANGENLMAVCTDDETLPMPATFLTWIQQDPSLEERYNAALQMRTDLLVEELLDTADGFDAARSRNQMNARQFHAERMMPGKYGPRAYQATVPADDADKGGIDYGADVRRKLEQMSARLEAEAAAKGSG